MLEEKKTLEIYSQARDLLAAVRVIQHCDYDNSRSWPSRNHFQAEHNRKQHQLIPELSLWRRCKWREVDIWSLGYIATELVSAQVPESEFRVIPRAWVLKNIFFEFSDPEIVRP